MISIANNCLVPCAHFKPEVCQDRVDPVLSSTTMYVMTRQPNSPTRLEVDWEWLNIHSRVLFAAF